MARIVSVCVCVGCQFESREESRRVNWRVPISHYMKEERLSRMRAARERAFHHGAVCSQLGALSNRLVLSAKSLQGAASVHGAESRDSLNAVSQLANQAASHAN